MSAEIIKPLRFVDWPLTLQEAWRSNIKRQSWKQPYARCILSGVERWYGWAGSDVLPNAESLAGYEYALRQYLKKRTVITYLQHLAYGIQLVAPENDWDWLIRSVLDRLPRPVRAEKPSRSTPRPKVCLPVADWPEPWRQRWQAVVGSTGGSRFRHRRTNRTADWSASYRRRVERGVGTLAAFTEERRAELVISESLVMDFLDWCADRKISGQSMGMYVEEIHRAFKLMEPAVDLQWLHELADELAGAASVRNKRARIVRSDQIQQKGLSLIRDASRRPLTTATALQYRDGLMMALWSVRPYRLRNFALLTIGDSLLIAEDSATIVIHDTKNGDGQPMNWPPVLFLPLKEYLRNYRKFLRNGGADNGRLWLGRDGKAMTPGSISRHFGDLTERHFGHRINPHLVRDCAATSIMEFDPRETLRASALLGQRDRRTTERHYQHATSHAAAALVHDLLSVYRIPPAERVRNRIG